MDVAQSGRVSVSKTEGCGFDPHRPCVNISYFALAGFVLLMLGLLFATLAVFLGWAATVVTYSDVLVGVGVGLLVLSLRD